jgi:coenzyme Q-binding protein COQ10
VNLFSPSSFIGTQTRTKTSRLPYAPEPLFRLIADIDSYASYLPFCLASRVTAWTTASAPESQRWPTRGDLTVGWGPLTLSYTSRVYCQPYRVIEAISGTATLEELNLQGEHVSEAKADDLFKSLATRWEFVPDERGTLVMLSIKYEFTSLEHQLIAGASGGEAASSMVAAFEKRARSVLEEPKGSNRKL